MSNNILEMKSISKMFGENLVVDDFTLEVERNQFITLLGPSGCGKTTILRMIAGFEDLTEGEILFEGTRLNTIPAYKREINTVFQNYALFPHLTVFDNIAFGLRLKKINEKEVNSRVMEALEMVKLTGYEQRSIDELSGGQQQRVALARAIINRPKLLLLDEPLSALDLKLRQDMQYEIKDLQNRLEISFIFVTHDQEEALTMSDKIVVMNEGKILQIGTPEDIYNEPENKFVASFIGESNIVDGKYLGDYNVSFLGKKFECVDHFNKEINVEVVIRPEDIEVVSVKEGQIIGRVDDIVFKGVHYELSVIVDNKELIIHTLKSPKINERIGMKIGPEDIHLMRASNE
jgi:spermidine/putrescine transport system ATP-binding protein